MAVDHSGGGEEGGEGGGVEIKCRSSARDEVRFM